MTLQFIIEVTYARTNSLAAEHEQECSMVLSVKACNAFLCCCTKASSNTSNSTEGFLKMLRGMQSPLPVSYVETFPGVIMCPLFNLIDSVPAYQLLMQLISRCC